MIRIDTLLVLILFILSQPTKVFSIKSPYVHSCCFTQFAFEEEKGCYVWGETQEIIYFPENLFGHFKFLPKWPNCNDTIRIDVPLEDLKRTIENVGKFKFKQTSYARDEYCIRSIGNETAEIVVADKAKCYQPRIPKCCNHNEAFDLQKNDCSGTDEDDLQQQVKTNENSVKKLLGCTKVNNFTNVNCWNDAVRYALKINQEKVAVHYEFDTGVFVRGGNWKELEQPYCVEKISNFASLCSNPAPNSQPEIVFYCAEGEDEISTKFYAWAMGTLWIVTSFLLFVTSVLNVTRIQKNSHGWVLFCYLVTSALLNFIAGIFILLQDDKSGGCNFLDFATKFLYTSTLCWMTMVNFDLWWTFRKLGNVKRPEIRKRLPYYCSFAWTIPTAITLTCWFIGKSRARKALERHCILFDHSLILYSSGPVVLLIFVNLCLFIRTAVTIQKIRSSTKLVLRDSRVQRESFKLFSKLFLMSGPIWVLRVILLALQFRGNYLTWYGVLIEMVFSVPDIAFFLLVILHPKVNLVEKIPCLKRVSTWFHEPSVVARPSISLQDQSSLKRKIESLQRKCNTAAV